MPRTGLGCAIESVSLGKVYGDRSEGQSHPELRRARRAVALQARDDQKRAQTAIALRIDEVHTVRHVENVDECIQRARAQLKPIPRAQIQLQVTGPACAARSATVLNRNASRS